MSTQVWGALLVFTEFSSSQTSGTLSLHGWSTVARLLLLLLIIIILCAWVCLVCVGGWAHLHRHVQRLEVSVRTSSSVTSSCYFTYILCMCLFIIYLCVCTLMCYVHLRGQRTTGKCWFSLSIMWVSGIELSCYIWEKVTLPTDLSFWPFTFFFFETRSLLEPDTCCLLPLPSGGNGVTGYMPNYMRTCLPNFFSTLPKYNLQTMWYNVSLSMKT